MVPEVKLILKPDFITFTMIWLPVFQAKLLCIMDEFGQSSDAFKELHTATDLALCATKAIAQLIDKAMANFVVLEHHIWLNLDQGRWQGRHPMLASLSQRTVLPSHGWFWEFTVAQKLSQAMCHFLLNRSSVAAVSSRQTAPYSLQPVKPVPPQPKP